MIFCLYLDFIASIIWSCAVAVICALKNYWKKMRETKFKPKYCLNAYSNITTSNKCFQFVRSFIAFMCNVCVWFILLNAFNRLFHFIIFILDEIRSPSQANSSAQLVSMIQLTLFRRWFSCSKRAGPKNKNGNGKRERKECTKMRFCLFSWNLTESLNVPWKTNLRVSVRFNFISKNDRPRLRWRKKRIRKSDKHIINKWAQTLIQYGRQFQLIQISKKWVKINNRFLFISTSQLERRLMNIIKTYKPIITTTTLTLHKYTYKAK